MIVVGLYFVLWGKSEERKFAKEHAAITSTPEHSGIRSSSHAKTLLTQPLLPSSTENVWSTKPYMTSSWGTIFSERKREKEDIKRRKWYPVIYIITTLCQEACVCTKGFSSFLFYFILVNSHAFFLGLLEWGFSMGIITMMDAT